MKPSLFPLLALAAALGGCATPPPGGESPLRDGTVTVALGKHARFVGLDVVPLRIEEDSRCPTGVQCIQAGTVRLAVRIGDGRARSERILTLDKPAELAGRGWLSLAAVCPYPQQPGRIARSSYRFTFTYARHAAPTPLDFDCSR